MVAHGKDKGTPLQKPRRIPRVSARLILSVRMNKLTRDGTVESFMRDRFSGVNGYRKENVSVQLDHEQDLQPYPVD